MVTLDWSVMLTLVDEHWSVMLTRDRIIHISQRKYVIR